MRPDAHADLAVAHNQLGNTYKDANQPDTAAQHYQQSIKYSESQGDRFNAGQTKENLARLLQEQPGRRADALAYARAALADFQSYGRNAPAEYVARAEALIAALKAAGGQ